ncbi:SMEK domain-containing protein [Pectobacterium versatile]|uniref:SMEK domain-containing protein n=1 Tax=Pectobacterium versatile TaxID=2488639 RepID=UPI00382FC2AC
MESESSFIARKLRFFTATLYAQIKLSTRDGLNDLPKNQEVSLLSLINFAYGTDFQDLNKSRQNYPIIDYGSLSMNTGLQMTASVTKKKFQDTYNTHTNNEVLNQTYPNIWFFLLTVEPVNASSKLPSPNIKYITLFDMVTEVLRKDNFFQNSFLNLLKKEYHLYFFHSMDKTTFLIPSEIPVPTDLMLFNELVSTKEWFPDNPGDGYIKVFNLIDEFHKRLRMCSHLAREILVSIIKLAIPPKYQNEKIIVYADSVLGSLNIGEEQMSDFEYHYNFLESNSLVERLDESQGLYTVGEDVYIKNRMKFVLNFGTYEPELNLFSALYIFYSNRHGINDFESAILNCDFSKLSDSLY